MLPSSVKTEENETKKRGKKRKKKNGGIEKKAVHKSKTLSPENHKTNNSINKTIIIKCSYCKEGILQNRGEKKICLMFTFQIFIFSASVQEKATGERACLFVHSCN